MRISLEMKTDSMTHKEFIKAYKEDKICAYVNRNKAISSLKSHFAPKSSKFIYSLWMQMFLLCFPFAVVSFIWIKWWVGLIVIISIFVQSKLMRELACHTVRKLAIDNEFFYEEVIDTGVLVLANGESGNYGKGEL